jgi:hypothetical protein
MKISELKSAIREMIIGELTMVDKMTTPDEAATIAKDEKKDINTVKDAIATAKKSGKSVTIAEDDVNEMAFLKGPKAPEGLEAAITAVVKSNSDAELADIRKAVKTDEKVISALKKVGIDKVSDGIADNQLNNFIELIRGNRVIGKLGRPADPNKPAKEPKEKQAKDSTKPTTSAKKKEPKMKTFSVGTKKYYAGGEDEEGPSNLELRKLAKSKPVGKVEKGKTAQLRAQEKTKLVQAFLKDMRDAGVVDDANRVLDKERYVDSWSKAKIEIEDKVSKLK